MGRGGQILPPRRRFLSTQRRFQQLATHYLPNEGGTTDGRLGLEGRARVGGGIKSRSP